jgi:hypothetical protein
MGRRRRHPLLRVLLNNRPVGQLSKDPGGAISSRYDKAWLDWSHNDPHQAFPGPATGSGSTAPQERTPNAGVGVDLERAAAINP